MPSGAVPAITPAAAHTGRRQATRPGPRISSASTASAAIRPTTTPYGCVYVVSTSRAAVPAQ